MAAAKLKLEIKTAINGEWYFHVIRGSRVILTPGETYKQRGGVRRAVKALAEISTDKSSTSWVSPLQAAALQGLRVEQDAWNKRKGGRK